MLMSTMLRRHETSLNIALLNNGLSPSLLMPAAGHAAGHGGQMGGRTIGVRLDQGPSGDGGAKRLNDASALSYGGMDNMGGGMSGERSKQCTAACSVCASCAWLGRDVPSVHLSGTLVGAEPQAVPFRALDMLIS